MSQHQELLDDKLSELRQKIWIELWALDDASAVLENDYIENRIILASLKSGNRLQFEYSEQLNGEITPIFLETLRQEFVNAKIIESDYHAITDKVDSVLHEIRDEILTDYNQWKDKINTLIDRVNEITVVLNEQVQRNE